MGKRAIIVLGGTGFGKTTLLQALRGEPIRYHKTQAIEYCSLAIDTPGEFSQQPRFYHALVSTVTDAQAIWVLQDATSHLGGVFPEVILQIRQLRPVRGLITKVDHPKADVKRAAALLATAKVPPPYYEVSCYTGRGLDALRALPEWQETLLSV